MKYWFKLKCSKNIKGSGGCSFVRALNFKQRIFEENECTARVALTRPISKCAFITDCLDYRASIIVWRLAFSRAKTHYKSHFLVAVNFTLWKLIKKQIFKRKLEAIITLSTWAGIRSCRPWRFFCRPPSRRCTLLLRLQLRENPRRQTCWKYKAYEELNIKLLI